MCAIGCNGQWGGWASYHPTVDLAAPGESIYSAIIGSGYASWNGSSMAGPNAASCIGLLKAFYPDMDNDQLMSTARDMNAPFSLLQQVNKIGKLPVPNFSAGGIASPADASLVMQLGAESVFVGSGIFKSEDGGTSWRAMGLEKTKTIHRILIDPNNENIIYVGAGEKTVRGNVSPGYGGFWKSDDAGETWKKMNLDIDQVQVGRIAIHPKNPDIVYFAALGNLWKPNKERGLYKSIDGGKSWLNIGFKNSETLKIGFTSCELVSVIIIN